MLFGLSRVLGPVAATWVVLLLEVVPHVLLVVDEVLDDHLGAFLLFVRAGLAAVLQGVGEEF